MSIIQFGIILERELRETLKNYSIENLFANRVKRIRHLIKNNIIISKSQYNNFILSSITLLYDLCKRIILNSLTELRNRYHKVNLTSHIHLENNRCMEIIGVKNKVDTLNVLPINSMRQIVFNKKN